MRIKTMVLGELSTNCYVVSSVEDDYAVIIDPGDEANHIQEYILHNNITPKAILITHGHFDHILAAHELSINFQIPIYMSKKDSFLTERMIETAEHFIGKGVYLKPEHFIDVNDGDEICFGNINFTVISIPGHTPGSVGYKIDESIFTGDLIFEGGSVGEYRHKYSSYKDLMASIDKIKNLRNGITLYPGHGNPVSIRDLQ